jgi:DNA-binding MarR family transcriptional regulator
MSADWDEVSYVISSSYRVKTLHRLADSPATPSGIAEDTDCPIAHISRALQGLRERGLVDLLVSEDRQKGRVYGITDRGDTIWKTIEGQNLA